MRPYSVAETYDPMTQRVLPYAEIASHIVERLRRNASTVQTILDMACGTGNLTIPLAELGYRVTGLDVAPQMLAIARKKATVSGLDIEFICQDMREAYPGAPVDAVTCFYGGLNFLDTHEALRQGFTAMYHALKPGGVVAFDLFSSNKMRSIFSGTKAADYGDFYALTKSVSDETGHIIHDVTFFLRDHDGRYRREEERHRLRIHPLATVRQLLSAVDFTHVMVEPFSAPVNTRLLHDVSLVVAKKSL